MLMLQTVILYLKKYWFIAAAVGVCIFMIIVKMNANAQIKKLLEELAANDKLHQEELRKIQEAHDVQTKEREEHLQQLENQLKQVEQQFVEAKAQLDAQKREEIKVILEKYGDDPDELAKQLSTATGIPIVITP